MQKQGRSRNNGNVFLLLILFHRHCRPSQDSQYEIPSNDSRISRCQIETEKQAHWSYSSRRKLSLRMSWTESEFRLAVRKKALLPEQKAFLRMQTLKSITRFTEIWRNWVSGFTSMALPYQSEPAGFCHWSGRRCRYPSCLKHVVEILAWRQISRRQTASRPTRILWKSIQRRSDIGRERGPSILAVDRQTIDLIHSRCLIPFAPRPGNTFNEESYLYTMRL